METPPSKAVEAGGSGWPKAHSPAPPKPSKCAPSPPDALLDPNTPCHWVPGTEPAFFISSRLLWQPCVCLVFTSRDAWRLSLLDHTRAASQRFPSSADIFLMMLLPLYPFLWSSPRRCSCGPCPASGPERRQLLAPLATASPIASLGKPAGLPQARHKQLAHGSWWAHGSGYISLLAPERLPGLLGWLLWLWGCRELSV